MNLCCACGEDFSSVSAFDRHRVGKHAYTYAEGLRMSPERHDGRRCMDEAEIREAGMEPNGRGRWSVPGDPGRFASLGIASTMPLEAIQSAAEAMIGSSEVAEGNATVVSKVGTL